MRRRIFTWLGYFKQRMFRLSVVVALEGCYIGSFLGYVFVFLFGWLLGLAGVGILAVYCYFIGCLSWVFCGGGEGMTLVRWLVPFFGVGGVNHYSVLF